MPEAPFKETNPMSNSPGAAQNQMTEFYDSLETLPKLISDIALSIAEAQRRLDQNYIESLTAMAGIFGNLIKTDASKVADFGAFFKAMGPTRYQFTETVVEVRADLQMTTMSQTQVAGSVGFTAPVAVAVNASYTRRNSYDSRAAATIRTVLNAIPSDTALMSQLLDRAGSPPSATLPDSARYKALWDAFGQFVQAVPSLPAASSPPASPAESPAEK
jgi:hypothetical protein